MVFMRIFTIVFLSSIFLVGCATNPMLNGMRYDVDRYRGHDMLPESSDETLSKFTGMRNNIGEYRGASLLQNEESPSIYYKLTGMRRNIDEFRSLTLAEGGNIQYENDEDYSNDESSDGEYRMIVDPEDNLGVNPQLQDGQ